MKTILLISPYWKEDHRWMVSSVKLSELWQRLGYRVVVACMGHVGGQEDKRAKGSEVPEIVSETLTIYRKKDFFLPDPWNYGIALGFSGLVRRILKEKKPDIVVVNKVLFWTSLTTMWLRLTGRKPIVLTDALVGMTWWPRGLLPRIGAAIYAWTLGWLVLLSATKVVLFHPQPVGLLRRLCIWKKTRVIPTGVDVARYACMRVCVKHDAMIRSSDAVGDVQREPRKEPTSQQVTVTYIGRLESVKGVEDFLAAATMARHAYPDLKIQVVGWYPSTSAGHPDHPLVTQYQRDVTFTGLRHDIPEILKTTDIFVLPSYSEGLSNALMEAMASGCACIASDVGGNIFLLQNGVSGFLFPAGDREALRSHIERLIADAAKRTMLGEAARKRIEEVFSWDVIGQQYRSLFEAHV